MSTNKYRVQQHGGRTQPPLLHYKTMEHTKTSLQESEQATTDRDTNTRHRKHGGERLAQRLPHTTTSHRISPTHT
jgi:hypothetical protein